ncbi:MAG: hypothetical protein M3O87_05195, partial [Candidatus Dormibacteraeota bacterium]|nr:hypothetical protein [Candidatus Dormibacteraeota bacterium]
MAAVRHYYELEDVAREQGAVGPMTTVTGGPGTPAFENLKLFIDQQKQAGRRSVTANNTFSDWSVHLFTGGAEVTYSILQTGHDVD